MRENGKMRKWKMGNWNSGGGGCRGTGLEVSAAPDSRTLACPAAPARCVVVVVGQPTALVGWRPGPGMDPYDERQTVDWEDLDKKLL